MAKRGRAPGFKMTDEHRLKIANSNILTYLLNHVAGDREMSPTQVQAAVALIRKYLPDLAQHQHGGDKDNPIVHEVDVGFRALVETLGAMQPSTKGSADDEN
jgi:hypothetical protein